MTCSICKTEKPREAFVKSKRRRSGIQPFCKPCNSERIRVYVRGRPDYSANSNLQKNYGISLAQYRSMLEDQGGVCKVCKGPALGKGRHHVDHCHKTGRIRGLLCHKCNVALGMVGDSVDRLHALISYLELT